MHPVSTFKVFWCFQGVEKVYWEQMGQIFRECPK